jgi:hypothetical protein
MTDKNIKKTNIISDDKKRGGQPGNQNARTHGFYSRTLTPEQQETLEAAADLRNLDDEIALMRFKISSIITHDPDNHAALLMAVSLLTKMITVNGDYKAKQEHNEPNKISIIEVCRPYPKPAQQSDFSPLPAQMPVTS